MKSRKKRKSLRERILKTVPVYGERFEEEHLRDWDKEARLLIVKEFDNAEEHIVPMLKIAMKGDDKGSIERIEEVRIQLRKVKDTVKASPAPYSPTYAAMKTVGPEEIKQIIELDEKAYEASQDISEAMQEAEDGFNGEREAALKKAESVRESIKEIKSLYNQRHKIITRPKEYGEPPYDR